MQSAKPVLCIFIFILIFNEADALELRFHPGNQLYLNEANGRFNTHDLIAHLLVVKNDSNKTVKLEKIRYQLFAGDTLVQEIHVPAENLVKATAELVGMKAEGIMIAAIARREDITLVTHNTGEFKKIEGLLLEDWF